MILRTSPLSFGEGLGVRSIINAQGSVLTVETKDGDFTEFPYY
jgi:hypothetical protein